MNRLQLLDGGEPRFVDRTPAKPSVRIDAARRQFPGRAGRVAWPRTAGRRWSWSRSGATRHGAALEPESLPGHRRARSEPRREHHAGAPGTARLEPQRSPAVLDPTLGAVRRARSRRGPVARLRARCSRRRRRGRSRPGERSGPGSSAGSRPAPSGATGTWRSANRAASRRAGQARRGAGRRSRTGPWRRSRPARRSAGRRSSTRPPPQRASARGPSRPSGRFEPSASIRSSHSEIRSRP